MDKWTIGLVAAVAAVAAASAYGARKNPPAPDLSIAAGSASVVGSSFKGDDGMVVLSPFKGDDGMVVRPPFKGDDSTAGLQDE